MRVPVQWAKENLMAKKSDKKPTFSGSKRLSSDDISDVLHARMIERMQELSRGDDRYLTLDMYSGEFVQLPSIEEKRKPRAERDSPSAERIDVLIANLELIQTSLRTKTQQLLQELSGKEYDTLEAKREVVSKINRLLSAADARIECPNCGEPASLRCAVTGNAKDGAFQFEHHRPKTVHGAKTRFPEDLRLS